MTSAWLQPIAFFLCTLLRPASSAATYVIQSSQEFLSRHGRCMIPEGYVIVIIDAKELYPSIEHEHFSALVSENIRRFSTSDVAKALGIDKYSIAELTIVLLTPLLEAQVVLFDGEYWLIVTGIATGLACGVHMANAYLDFFDTFVIAAGFPLLWYARFLDDACVCIPEDQLDDLVAHMNTWQSSIKWECTAFGTSNVAFLDLCLSVVNEELTWETFRKPQNAYLYLPASSCHDPSVFSSLVHSETTRLIKTNKYQRTLRKHLDFFKQRLVDRGYERSIIRKHIRAALCKARHHASGFGKPKIKIHSNFMKLKFGNSVDAAHIRRIISKHSKAVSHFGHVGLCFSVQPSLFRRLYKLNWPRVWPNNFDAT